MLYYKRDKFINNIRERYNEKGLIPEDLKKVSDKIDGVDFKELRNMLNDSSKDDLSVRIVIAFANIFNCSINEILGFEDIYVTKEEPVIKEVIIPEPEDIAELIVELKLLKNNSEKFETVKNLIKLLNK